MGASKPKKQTVGYHYSIGMHLIICHGPIDGVKQIWVGEKCAWPNPDNVEAQAPDGEVIIVIDEPELFGGESREGGIEGTVNIAYGKSDQGKNDYLEEQLDPTDGFIPTFRGLVGVILRQVRVGTSPYIKPCSFLVKRTHILSDGSTQWYSTKSNIDGDMNPVHIIRECLTNKIWGKGESVVSIDNDNFRGVADVLYNEEFGLSFLWDNDTSIEDFVNKVLNHIDGILYQDIGTGLYKISLARDDYNVDDLDEFDEENIVEVKDFRKDAYGEITNQIIIKYSDAIKDKGATVTLHDIALIDMQDGNTIETTIDYEGITKEGLANRIAARDLKQASSLLTRMTIIGNRTMFQLHPNSVFKLSWPIYGIEQMVMRVVQINYGSIIEGTITIEAIEDIFSTASTMYVDPPSTQWTDPVSQPQAAPARKLLEIPYWTLVKEFGDSVVEGSLDTDVGFLGVSAMRPSNDAINYELLVRDGLTLDFTSEGLEAFTPTATLTNNLAENAVEATIDLNGCYDLENVEDNTYALIGDEIIAVKSVDIINEQITIARGILDTIPVSHSAGDRIWFYESTGFFVGREYADSEQPGVKILPSTGKGRFTEAEATGYNASLMNSRQIRPYPPGNFKIDGNSYPSSFIGQPTISWSHRDRTQQTAYLVEHNEVDIGPEDGVTYTLKIYDENNVLVRTETGLTNNSYTYDELDEMADCGLNSGDPLNTQLRFVLYSVRDGYDSWQSYDITVQRTV